jgi:putative transcriptional regulator
LFIKRPHTEEREVVGLDRRGMIKETLEVLAKAGFYTTDPSLFRTVNFDIIARRDAMLLIIKILTNIDAMKKDVAEQLKVVANHLAAFPLLVGDRSNTDLLEEGVVYLRHGIPVMSLGTLTDYFIEGVPPFIFSAPGGPYINIDGDELRKIRTSKGISLGELAKAAGVSRKSIQLYESGTKAMFNVVVKIEKYLDHPIATPVEPFAIVTDVGEDVFRTGDTRGRFATHVFKRLRGLGFVVIKTVKCPFDALSEEKKTLILTGLGRSNRPTLEKAKIMANISKITERDSVIVMEKDTSKQNIGGTPVIGRKELDDLEDTDEVITLVKERKK